MAYNKSIVDQFREINMLSAIALMVYAFTTLVMAGVAGIAIDWLEAYKFLPMAATFAAFATIFAVSGTRDPRHYHPVEWGIVGITAFVVILNAFMVEVSDFITSAWPWGAIAMIGLMLVSGAIVAR